MPTLKLHQHYASLPNAFYRHVKPTGIGKAHWLIINKHLANKLNIALTDDDNQSMLDICAGNKPIDDSTPIAMAYAGHQFGYYVPALGDGRGLLLGEVAVKTNEQTRYWDIHLKGAGPTPYSRNGDGRAVLRSTIREYLGSEAMHALGIATTRALCATSSQLTVTREKDETAATLIRVARSHIRFGHFEYFHHQGKHEHVKTLADFCIKQYANDIDFSGQKNLYLDLFRHAVRSTAKMIAMWTAYGFAHGVMNTDNMSILGDTLDYGPYAFLDDYNPLLICNHSDTQGRYAFYRQASIGLWNLHALATAMSRLIDTDELHKELQCYEQNFYRQYTDIMQKRLGLSQCNEDIMPLVNQLLQLLQAAKADYNVSLRTLSNITRTDNTFDWLYISGLPHYKTHADQWQNWLRQYKSILTRYMIDDIERSEAMNQVNPLYVLRNYYAQLAIESAENGDNSVLHDLANVLTEPFHRHETDIDYSLPPPEEGKELPISCSS